MIADAKPNLEKPIPVEPEQIPFVPASQRQATATHLKFKQTTKYSALEDSEDDDEIVEVKDPSRKKQRKAKAKAEFVETSLLAAASGSSTPAGTQDDDADMITLDKEGDGVDGKKKRKRKKNSAGAETPTEPAVPYDYSTAPNLLDEGLDEFEKGKSGKKRKTEKQRGSGKAKKRGWPFAVSNSLRSLTGFSLFRRSFRIGLRLRCTSASSNRAQIGEQVHDV